VRASVVVVHGLSCPAAYGIFPDQGLNHVPCVGRQILTHCTIREVPGEWFNPQPISLPQRLEGGAERSSL